jgi:hypothetical protein
MEICAHITWEDGQTSEHQIAWCDEEPLEAIAEQLSQALAEYLDEQEWPTDTDGILLAWVAVDVSAETN